MVCIERADARGETESPRGRARREAVEALQLANRLRSAGYDVASTCNLRCEGCFYFSGERSNIAPETGTPDDWAAFFRDEGERGVNYAFLAGAEPSLQLGRIRAAAAAIPCGMVFTNGTKRIPDDIPYRLHISLWGGDESAGRLRGANVNAKAFRNYAGDRRAVFVFTISAANIGEIAPMAARCHDHGVPITFNYFSPTSAYLAQLRAEAAHDDAYFRFSTPDDNLRLMPADLARAHAEIEAVQARWPDTVLYSSAYDRWIGRTPSPYTLDADGVAIDCSFRANGWHRHHQIGREASPEKCGNPNLDCSECRTYAAGLTSFIRRREGGSGKSDSLADWVDAFRLWQAVFLGDQVERLHAAR